MLRIDGAAVRDIASFYAEVNRVFMADEPWDLGPSLDALDDLLYGDVGALGRARPARVVWADHEVSRRALGREATVAHYREKLRHPGAYRAATAQAALDALDAGGGATYFDLVLTVFAGHPDVELVLA